MRVGILGDSHGDLTAARLLLRSMGKIDLLLHTGDYYEDALRMARWPELEGVPVRAVLGNGDYQAGGPADAMLELEGLRLWLVHGHRFDVKHDPAFTRLVEEGRRRRADVVVFGHTHVSGIFEREGLLLVNPGSTRFPRRRSPGSAAILELTRTGPQADLIELAQTAAEWTGAERPKNAR